MDWRYNTIWFDQIETNKHQTLDWKEKYGGILNLDDKDYAIIWYFKQKGISSYQLPESNSLLYLELNSANVKDFNGIGKYESLKRLELHYCTKLDSDYGLSSLQDSLEFLVVNQSKKYTPSSELTRLKNLKVLCLNSCGPIADLEFLEELPNLIDFRFVNTDIINGDLTPILEHPNIKSVGFSNKRHYNYKDSQIDLELESKLPLDYMDWVYKGEYKTFKYKNYSG